MSDILEKIRLYKLDEVAHRKSRASLADLDRAASAAGPPRGFKVALSRDAGPGRPALIAEIKKASPSKGVIRADFHPETLAKAYYAGGASCLSVLTDEPSFQGADRYLVEARNAAPLPALRKEFLVDPWQVIESRALGADAVLIIMAMVEDGLALELLKEARRLGMDALVEVHDEEEFDRAGDLGADLMGVNNRDLRTFATDLGVTERLAPRVTGDMLLVAESGINGAEDARRLARVGAKAMLVGESLMRQPNLLQATRALLGS